MSKTMEVQVFFNVQNHLLQCPKPSSSSSFSSINSSISKTILFFFFNYQKEKKINGIIFLTGRWYKINTPKQQLHSNSMSSCFSFYSISSMSKTIFFFFSNFPTTIMPSSSSIVDIKSIHSNNNFIQIQCHILLFFSPIIQ